MHMKIFPSQHLGLTKYIRLKLSDPFTPIHVQLYRQAGRPSSTGVRKQKGEENP